MEVSEKTKITLTLGLLVSVIGAIISGAIWLTNLNAKVNTVSTQTKLIPVMQEDISGVKEDMAFVKGIMTQIKNKEVSIKPLPWR